MPTKTLDVRDAQATLADILTSVAAGAEVILAREGTPVARVLPIAPPASERVPGLHAGAAWMSDDFDAPLPDSFWTAGA